MQSINPKELSIIELKAIKSDCRDVIDAQQQNINLINAELILRAEADKKKEEVEEVKPE